MAIDNYARTLAVKAIGSGGGGGGDVNFTPISENTQDTNFGSLLYGKDSDTLYKDDVTTKSYIDSNGKLVYRFGTSNTKYIDISEDGFNSVSPSSSAKIEYSSVAPIGKRFIIEAILRGSLYGRTTIYSNDVKVELPSKTVSLVELYNKLGDIESALDAINGEYTMQVDPPYVVE